MDAHCILDARAFSFLYVDCVGVSGEKRMRKRKRKSPDEKIAAVHVPFYWPPVLLLMIYEYLPFYEHVLLNDQLSEVQLQALLVVQVESELARVVGADTFRTVLKPALIQSNAVIAGSFVVDVITGEIERKYRTNVPPTLRPFEHSRDPVVQEEIISNSKRFVSKVHPIDYKDMFGSSSYDPKLFEENEKSFDIDIFVPVHEIDIKTFEDTRKDLHDPMHYASGMEVDIYRHPDAFAYDSAIHHNASNYGHILGKAIQFVRQYSTTQMHVTPSPKLEVVQVKYQSNRLDEIVSWIKESFDISACSIMYQPSHPTQPIRSTRSEILDVVKKQATFTYQNMKSINRYDKYRSRGFQFNDLSEPQILFKFFEELINKEAGRIILVLPPQDGTKDQQDDPYDYNYTWFDAKIEWCWPGYCLTEYSDNNEQMKKQVGPNVCCPSYTNRTCIYNMCRVDHMHVSKDYVWVSYASLRNLEITTDHLRRMTNYAPR